MWEARQSNSCGAIIFMVLIIFFSHIELTTTKRDHYTLLIWNFPWPVPGLFEETNNNYFIKQNCAFKNCNITRSDSVIDVKRYDFIIINSMALLTLQKPNSRSATQRYVFFSDEPAAMYPVTSTYNGFFDITWTYKLNSDATFKYIVVRDKDGTVIAPKRDVQWVDASKMIPISEHIRKKLQTKKIAAAWFVTHCETIGKREVFVRRLISELNVYGLKIDIFGSCGYGNLTCAQNNEECHAYIETDYYFYLAFENSFCEDYVTEKVLTALKHYTVPVVYGGADYRRFLPDGAYLNANYLNPKSLARAMNKAIHNKVIYYDFFRWHNYYSFHAPNESADTDEICGFCALLNDKTFSREMSVYEDLAGFWNPKPNEGNPEKIPNANWSDFFGQ